MVQEMSGSGGPAAAVDPAPSVASLPPEAVALAGRLFDAARQGQTDIFEQVFSRSERLANLTNEKGDSLIMLATYHGHLPLTKLLLAHGADPNRLNERQQSPLAGAIFKGEDAVVDALLQAGADPRIGTPSAIEAINIFGQQEKWGEKLTKVVTELDSKAPLTNGGVKTQGQEEVLKGEDGEELYEEAKFPGE